MSNKNKINLLTDIEIEELYARPKFNDMERSYYFRLDEMEFKLLKKYTNLKSKIFLILQIGYFRAKQQFYKFKLDEVIDDVDYIIKKYYSFDDKNKTIKGQLWKENYKKQKSDILKLYEYREWNKRLVKKTLNQLEKLIRLYPKGNDTLRELFVFFESEKITIPSYRTLQDLFTKIFKMERFRLEEIISNISDNLKKELDEIIKNENGLTELNIIRMDQQDFSYSALRLELKKSEKIKSLYHLCKTFIPSLLISDNAVRYYASLIEQYPAFRLRKLKKSQQWLQMLCFIFNRYQEFMDNLIVTFLFHMRAFIVESKAYAEEKEREFIQGVLQELSGVGQFFTWFSSDENKEEKKNITVEEFKKTGFDIFSKEKQLAFVGLICGSGFDKKSARWDFYQKESRRISLYFRPILLAVDFEFYKKDAFIVELIQSMREFYLSNKHHDKLSQSISNDVIKKIPKKAMDLLKSSNSSDEINASRLEFYLYEKMNHQINRGRLFCNDSVSYCSLDYDLVPDAMVDNAKEICDGFGYKKIPVYCDERLDKALEELENAWARTNQGISDGSNNGIKIETTDLGITTWKLTYDADLKESSIFFDELPKQEIADIIKFMGDHLKIWILFESLKDRYVKHKRPSPLALIACVLADAFGFGIEKMAQISNISYNHLLTVDENFMYVENLKLVNDAFSNYIHSLPVSRIWDLIENKIVSDADGQKYETSHHTIQSRYSPKYFGTYKGISIYSLTANHISVNAKIIGPNEHESHHLYDVIFNNKSNIVIHMVTGDGHSINQTSFITLDSIDIDFIPSIKDIRAEAEKLYSTKDPDQYNGLIQPHGKINWKLIESEKRGIIRILLSLLLQKNTQAVIIKKLASHQRYSRLQAAFWEYNRIFKSTHVLGSFTKPLQRAWSSINLIQLLTLLLLKI